MMPTIKRILFTTDLSPNSEYVFRYAINSAIKHDAKIIILYVIEAMSPTGQTLLSAYLDADFQGKLMTEYIEHSDDQIKESLQKFCQTELNDDPDAIDRIETIETCTGYPAEVILKKADEFDCDAIVMGNHGKGLISETFLGSVSKRVLRRTRKPVFIIPIPPETSA
ncbi:MAG: universal stress protein [Desulfobacterales bacterium]|nr:universal stress protein [Desulfobacterales bacterium]